jgi:hypothetical protein
MMVALHNASPTCTRIAICSALIAFVLHVLLRDTR